MMPVLAEISHILRRVVQAFFFRPIAGPSAASPWTCFAVITIWTVSCLGLEAIVGGNNLGFNAHGLSYQFAGWALLAWAIMVLSGQYSTNVISALAHVAVVGILVNLIFTAWVLLAPPSIGQDGASFTRDVAIFVLIVFLYGMMVFRIGLNLWPKNVRWRGIRFLTAALVPMLLIPYQPTLYGDKTDWTRYDLWHLATIYASTSSSTEQKIAKQEPPVDYEAAFYRQKTLVEEKFAQIIATRPGVTDMYFLGVAPSSSEEVFRREITSARVAFDKRFATTGRSGVLINHKDTLTDTPLATATNLRFALQGLSQKMDVEEDILVLFISTHGSKDSLYVNLPGFRLNQLSAARLAESLDASGIKNRVIIISACHSGSFIDDLQNDRTLILTASAEDKVSFGCSNERHWTYFGDALFNYGLLQSSSFPEAFEIAKSMIVEWETSQNQTASEPQISIGKDILVRLNAYVAQISLDPEASSRRASVSGQLSSE